MHVASAMFVAPLYMCLSLRQQIDAQLATLVPWRAYRTGVRFGCVWSDMKRRAALMANVFAVLVIAIDGTGLVLLWVGRGLDLPDSWGFRGFPYLMSFSLLVSCYLIATRVPRNPIGWYGFFAAAILSLQGAGVDYAALGLYGGAPLPAPALAAWITNWIWVPGLAAFGVMGLIFPDGRLLSRRWIVAVAVIALGGALVATGAALEPTLQSTFGIANPLRLDLPEGLAVTLFQRGFAVFGLGNLAAAASLVVRYRRAQGETRLQLRWIAASAVVVSVAFSVQVLGPGEKALQILDAIASLTLPVAIAIAILRYRLYEIDTLINRALVYGALTAILAGLYTASIGLSQRVFTALTGEHSDAAIVLTTLVVAAAFTPVKSMLQTSVDRRFRPSGGTLHSLRAYTEQVRLVTLAFDPEALQRRSLEEIVRSVDAEGGAVLVGGRTVAMTGRWPQTPCLRLAIGGVELVLGPCRSGSSYRAEAQAAIRDVIEAVTAALALGHRPDAINA